MHIYLDSGVDIRNDEHGKNTEKSIFSLVEPSSSFTTKAEKGLRNEKDFRVALNSCHRTQLRT